MTVSCGEVGGGGLSDRGKGRIVLRTKLLMKGSGRGLR